MGIANTDFQIDQDNLDKEWEKQPSLYSKYARATADARREMDEAKSSLEVTKAERALYIRSNLVLYNLTKITESQLSQMVEVEEDVKTAMSNLIEARHHYEVLQAAVGALDHKKKALESLVSLWLADYFATPRAKGAAKEKMEEMEKQKLRRKRKAS